VNTRSIKFRLIAWYAGWLTVVFLVFGIVVYKSLDYYLERALRQALEMRTRHIASLTLGSTLDWAALGQEIHNRFAPEANNRFTRITADGEVRYVAGTPSDGSFDPKLVPAAKQKVQESFERRVLPGGGVLLVAVRPVMVNGRNVLIEEGFSKGGITATLRAWMVALSWSLVLLILLTVLGGYFVAQRALHPVDTIIRAAERISSRNLSERLPVPNTRDELERLSTALNNMIRRLEESFQHTQRFLADASHELRTPLTILQAELEAMLAQVGRGIEGRTPVPEPLRDVAASALEELDRLRNIVESLFALSRLDAGEAMNRSEQFDLGELVTSTADQMSLLALDKQISIICHVPEPLVVQGDRARLKQVAVNLLDNAIKYTPEGGEIHVRTAAQVGRGVLAEPHAVLEVSDNGIGIPPDALPHVFERFYRVDKARSRQLGGAGLGLSIVKSICTAHSGRVEVESKEGVGSSFRVILPLARHLPLTVSRSHDLTVSS
jgi:heavy metal sensor kinase